MKNNKSKNANLFLDGNWSEPLSGLVNSSTSPWVASRILLRAKAEQRVRDEIGETPLIDLQRPFESQNLRPEFLETFSPSDVISAVLDASIMDEEENLVFFAKDYWVDSISNVSTGISKYALVKSDANSLCDAMLEANQCMKALRALSGCGGNELSDEEKAYLKRKLFRFLPDKDEHESLEMANDYQAMCEDFIDYWNQFFQDEDFRQKELLHRSCEEIYRAFRRSLDDAEAYLAWRSMRRKVSILSRHRKNSYELMRQTERLYLLYQHKAPQIVLAREEARLMFYYLILNCARPMGGFDFSFDTLCLEKREKAAERVGFFKQSLSSVKSEV